MCQSHFGPSFPDAGGLLGKPSGGWHAREMGGCDGTGR